jgi:proteasome accessory factor A
VQRLYLQAAQKIEHSPDSETAWLLQEWENVLNDLERDVSLTRDRVDWVAKKFLLSALQEAEGLSWSDPWLQAIDLEYHNIDIETGLHAELVRQGSMRHFVSDDEIKLAIFSPPETTRAFFRGRAIARFTEHISSVQWDEIVFDNGGQSTRVALPEVSAADPRLERLNSAMRESNDFSTFLRSAAEAAL